MRVCSPHCGLSPETTSGGETYERELLRHLASLGIVFDLILARHKPVPEGVANWAIHRLWMRRGLRWPVAAIVFPPAIARVYRKTHFDVLRVHSLRYIGPAALLARRRYGLDVPIVAHHHHLDRNWLNPFIEKQVMRHAERVITVSEFSKRQAVTELGVPADKIAVVYDGVDSKFVRGPKPEHLLQRLRLCGKPVLLFVGGLKKRKNVFMLLDVWQKVARVRRDVQLVVVGTGHLLDELRRHGARIAPTGGIYFTGYVPEVDKIDYYRLADVFVSTSTMEGFGLTVAEAMSCGLPVVASDRGSIPEVLVDGEGGFLCDPARPESFVARLQLLLSDGALREKFGRANQERVERLFRWEHCARDTARVYEAVLDAWRRRPAARGRR